MSADLDIAELLGSLGFGEGDRARAREHLEALGLTHAKKRRISAAKRPVVEAALGQRFAVLCGAELCARAAARGRELVVAQPRTLCEHCGGSDNRKAFLRLQHLAEAHGVSRLVVVGGSPAAREELRAGAPEAWSLRLVDGTARRTAREAQVDLAWAHLVLVWGASELDHKVSNLYTEAPLPLRRKVVQLARRGVATLLHAACDHLEGPSWRE